MNGSGMPRQNYRCCGDGVVGVVGMRFGSLFAGIGGFDLGFERAGMECAWQVEIDKKCNQVLGQHWPDVERQKDVREIGKHSVNTVHIISGGFPCQDLSVAGNRAGLAGKRSRLWYEFHRILEIYRPTWVIVENVTGLLSSSAGKDTAIVLQGMEELGYKTVWRVLDAQYFGVPQRRRRIFVVGHLGDYRSFEVLFDSSCLSWDIDARRKERKEIAATLRSRFARSGVSTPGRGGEDDQNLIVGPVSGGAYGTGRRTEDDPNLVIANTLTSSNKRYDPSSENLIAGTVTGAEAHNGNSNPIPDNYIVWDNGQGDPNAEESGIAYALNTRGNQGVGVRRLMPIECERLQGFPDNWTEGHSDTARYKMIGNAVCVPVAEWIGRRIVEYDDG